MNWEERMQKCKDIIDTAFTASKEELDGIYRALNRIQTHLELAELLDINVGTHIGIDEELLKTKITEEMARNLLNKFHSQLHECHIKITERYEKQIAEHKRMEEQHRSALVPHACRG